MRLPGVSPFPRTVLSSLLRSWTLVTIFSPDGSMLNIFCSFPLACFLLLERGTSSSSVLHSPHVPHFPCHFWLVAPHSRHRNIAIKLRIVIDYNVRELKASPTFLLFFSLTVSIACSACRFSIFSSSVTRR